MSDLQRLLARAVEDRRMPFAVAAVADRSGLVWKGSSGHAAPGLPADQDTVMRIVSMTKAIGCTAVMMMVDRGLLDLDMSVASVLPEFDDLVVLESMGPEGPVFRPQKTRCTLRHLLTHTAGFAYDTFHGNQLAASQLPGAPNILGGTRESLKFPLMFDPGTDFVYGPAIDWACLMVEKVDGRPMNRICQEEIFDPLGMTSTTFAVEPLKSRLADAKYRDGDGGFADMAYDMPVNPEIYCMGHALYSTATDYLTFLQMVLNKGVLNGRRLLSPEAIDLMEQAQSDTRPVFKSVLPAVSSPVELFTSGTPQSWTSAFLRNDTALPGRRAAGSLCWAGFLNTHYWIDPANGITGVLMTQFLPFCDPQFMDVYFEFERLVYREFCSSQEIVPSVA